MKREDLERIFGKEKCPNLVEFCDWVLKNDPITFKSWDPPLDFEEIALISDPEFKETGFSYDNSRSEKLQELFPLFNHIREAKKEELRMNQILFWLEKLKKDKENLGYYTYERILEKHNISIKKIVEDLIYRLLEKIRKNPKEVNELNLLEEWNASPYGPITNLKSRIKIWQGSNPKKDLIKKHYDFFERCIIQAKIKDIKNNPQDWEIVRKVNMYGETSVSIERKDNKDNEISKKYFASWEFTKIEWKIEGFKNIKFWLPTLALVLILIFFFWWWCKRSKKQ